MREMKRRTKTAARNGKHGRSIIQKMSRKKLNPFHFSGIADLENQSRSWPLVNKIYAAHVGNYER